MCTDTDVYVSIMMLRRRYAFPQGSFHFQIIEYVLIHFRACAAHLGVFDFIHIAKFNLHGFFLSEQYYFFLFHFYFEKKESVLNYKWM